MWSMLIKSYSEGKILTMLFEEFLSMGKIMGSYLCMSKVDFESIHGGFQLLFHELYIYYAYGVCFYAKYDF